MGRLSYRASRSRRVVPSGVASSRSSARLFIMLRRPVRFRPFRVLLVTLTLITGLPLVLPVSARQADSADLQMNQLAIGQFLREYRARHHVPGLSVAIVRNRTVLHVAGYGQTPSRTALTPSTPMPIASLSKSFTSLAVMQLVEA